MIIFNHRVYRGPWQHNKHNQTFPLQNCIRGLALPESRAGKCRASWHRAAPVTGKGGKLPALCQSKARTHTHTSKLPITPLFLQRFLNLSQHEDVAVGGALSRLLRLPPAALPWRQNSCQWNRNRDGERDCGNM